MAFKMAITGGPASGKSTVLKKFAQKGVPVFSADEVVRELTTPGQKAWRKIKEIFGPKYFLPSGELDRRAILRLITADQRAKETLEAIIHPEVEVRLFSFFEKNKKVPLVVAEVPLLFEVGWEKYFDLVMVVYVPEEVQRRRLLERLKDPELVENFLRLQWPLTRKCELADLVILGMSPGT